MPPRRVNPCQFAHARQHRQDRCQICEDFRREGNRLRALQVDRRLQRLQQSYHSLVDQHGGSRLHLLVQFDLGLAKWPKNSGIHDDNYPTFCFRFAESVLIQNRMLDSTSGIEARSLASFPGAESFFNRWGFGARRFEYNIQQDELNLILGLFNAQPTLIRPALVASCALFSCFRPAPRANRRMMGYDSFFLPSLPEQQQAILDAIRRETREEEEDELVEEY